MTRFTTRALARLVGLSIFGTALVTGAAGVARARAPVPDIRGSYPLYGTQSVTGCASVGADFSSPLQGTLVITAQEGTGFAGTFGFPQQGVDLFALSGTVMPDGRIEGTWSLPQSPGGSAYAEQRVTGRIAGDATELNFTAEYRTTGIVCGFAATLAAIQATLTWQAPDPGSTAAFPPPRALTLAESAGSRSETRIEDVVAALAGFPPDAYERAASPRGGAVTGYKVYRSATPNVQTVPANLFAQLPPSQTGLPTGVSAGGAFFVVTATYETGESGPSNEVSGGLTPATLGNVKVSGTKIKATGAGFTAVVSVFVDGIPFVASAKVKNGSKVTQKGTLLTGQTLAQYVTSGRLVTISFRNSDGATATYLYTRQ